MELWILLSLQLAATALGFAYLWRRQRSLSDEIARLREALSALEGERAVVRRLPRRVEGAAAAAETGAVVSIAPRTPSARAERAWRLPDASLSFDTDLLSSDTTRGTLLGIAAAAPALGFFLALDSGLVVAAGLGVATAMMLLGLRAEWRAASWAGAITAGVWALVGFGLGGALASPIPFSVFAATAGIAGLVHAHLRRVIPGTLMALLMAMATLALASLTSVIGPAGAAYGVIVTAAAIVGAMSLRLEAVHLAAFGAALIGLFVLSGQDAAAIWFTPATAWAGALFLGIAYVRVPQLAARGVALAGVGALAPLAAIGTLHWAQNGLGDRFAAAGAYAALAFALGGLLALAASRRALASLRLTLWILAGAAFVAIFAAITLALRGPFAASAFAVVSLGLLALNARLPDAVWRAFASISAFFAAVFAVVSAGMLLNEAANWPTWLLIGLGLVAPALIYAAAAHVAHMTRAHFTAGFFEAIAFACATIASSLVIRLIFSGGAFLLHPVGFVEAGAHLATWLLTALLVAARSRSGAKAVRMGFAMLLGMTALLLCAFCTGLWLTPYWSARDSLSLHEPFGFLAPAIVFWAHWVFWRARGNDTRTRVSLGAGALLTACWVTLEAISWQGAPSWVSALIGAIAFALAIVINFAPGVTNAAGPRRS